MSKKIPVGRAIDLRGQHFGYLTPIYRVKNTIRPGQAKWRCRCDCGNETDVLAFHLTNGTARSCGCLKQSYGEQKIQQLLQKHQLKFQTEKTFTNCYFANTNKLPRFDFYVNNQYIIEFDGEYHYSNHRQIERDQEKTEWCKQQNIPLIRIPYTVNVDTLNITDLQIETSPFRVV